MNAYDVLKQKNIPKCIDEEKFNRQIIEFRESYFKENKYIERLSEHRKPLDLINGLLYGEYIDDGIYNLLKRIQNRDELRHKELYISTYVHHEINKIWTNNIKLKSRYDAIKEYCKLWSKDFNTIAVQIAEYKAMDQVRSRLERQRKRFLPKEIDFKKLKKIYKPEIGNLSLESLFVDKNAIEPCLNALREVGTPIIDGNKKYLLGVRQKGAIVAWVEVLKMRGKITNVDKINLAEILNNTFLGLNVSSRTLGNVNTTAYKKYHKRLTLLIK